MKYTVIISPSAKSDIRNIYNYIAYVLKSEQNAKGQTDRIKKAILSLDEQPERYKRYEVEPWNSRGLRVLPVNNYLVLYFTDNEKNIVDVYRVIYGGRNIEKQLEG